MLSISSLYFGFYIRKFREKKKIILCGEIKEALNLKKYTEILGYRVAYIIGEADEGAEKSYFDLIYEDVSEIFVWIVSNNYSKYCPKLDEMGLKPNENYGALFCPPYMNLHERFPIDLNIGLTAYTGDKYPGVKIFGDSEIVDENTIKVVTLGGSTTDAMAYPWKSWSELLWEMLVQKSKEKKVIIYCAGTCGYTSAQELMKLERDMLSLEPDIVISLSGVNDIHEDDTPWVNGYQKKIFSRMNEVNDDALHKSVNIDYSIGIKNNDLPYKKWIKNMRMMYTVCSEFGVGFYSFLQPMVGEKGYELDGVALEYMLGDMNDIYGKTASFIENVRAEIKNYNYILDIADIFNGTSEIYIDGIHTTEQGNKLIAQAICANIVGDKAFGKVETR